MTRKQQRKMNGGGLFDFLGFKKAEEINPDAVAIRFKELETKKPTELATMVVELEDKVKELEKKIQDLENPSAPAPAPTTENPLVQEAAVAPPATGGRRRQRKTRKSHK